MDCTLAVLFPVPDQLESLRQLQRRHSFGELLLVVEQIHAFFARCSAQGLALVAAPTAGQQTALVAALVMARHERVVVLEGQKPVEDGLDQICRTLATEEVDAVLPPSGAFCPGGYRRSCFRPLERALRGGRHTPSAALKGLRLKLE